MYWYGGLDPADHVPLFEAAVGRLAQAVDARLAVDQAIATAGCIINTGGFESHSSGGGGGGGGGGIPGAETLLTVVDRLRVDVVLVVGHDRLYEQLKSALQKKTQGAFSPSPSASAFPSASTTAANGFDGDQNDVVVIKLQRSGGVVSRDLSTRRRLQGRRFTDYFYGASLPLEELPTTSSSFSSTSSSSATTSSSESQNAMLPAYKPHIMGISFDKVKLWRHSSDSGSDMSGLMPVTATGMGQEPGQLERIEPDASLLHAVAAVYHVARQQSGEVSSRNGKSAAVAKDAMAIKMEEDDEMGQFEAEAAEAKALGTANVAGFVVIQEVNLERRTLTLLAPCAGKLPSLNLVVARDIQWMES